MDKILQRWCSQNKQLSANPNVDKTINMIMISKIQDTITNFDHHDVKIHMYLQKWLVNLRVSPVSSAFYFGPRKFCTWNIIQMVAINLKVEQQFLGRGNTEVNIRIMICGSTQSQLHIPNNFLLYLFCGFQKHLKLT